MEGNVALGKKLDLVAYVITAAVLVLVGIMRRVKIDVGIDFTFLPPVHAVLNTFVAIFLLAALIYIRKRDRKLHQRCVNMAMICSFLFLLCYVMYHFTTPETTYCKEGTIRTVYFIFLISHIILAGLSLPFILLTYIRAYTGQYAKHRRLSKIVWPIWFYVAITGPICYLMLKPCYN